MRQEKKARIAAICAAVLSAALGGGLVFLLAVADNDKKSVSSETQTEETAAASSPSAGATGRSSEEAQQDDTIQDDAAGGDVSVGGVTVGNLETLSCLGSEEADSMLAVLDGYLAQEGLSPVSVRAVAADSSTASCSATFEVDGVEVAVSSIVGGWEVSSGGAVVFTAQEPSVSLPSPSALEPSALSQFVSSEVATTLPRAWEAKASSAGIDPVGAVLDLSTIAVLPDHTGIEFDVVAADGSVWHATYAYSTRMLEIQE